MSKPRIAPQVLAEISENAPARLRRKLDRDPAVAESWAWSQQQDQWVVEAGNETVELDAAEGCVSAVESVRCSCLLGPRCFHVLACLSLLEIDAGSEPAPSRDDAGDEGPAAEDGDADAPTLTSQQRAAAAQAWRETAQWLAVGARSAGVMAQARLTRIVHDCRCHGLHRLAAAGLRVLHGARQLRSGDPSFQSAELMRDMYELAAAVWRLKSARGQVDAGWLGTARRRYRPIANLRFEALFNEPVLTRSGYAGVVTYLMAPDGTLATLSNVRPGDSSRLAQAWKSAVEIGGLSASHQQLCGNGLIVQTGAISDDRRLGTGQDSRAAQVASSQWGGEALAPRFDEPLADQVARVFAAWSGGPAAAGDDLLFLRGSVLGADGPGLLLQLAESGEVVRLDMPQDREALAYRDNLTLLARAPGLPLRCLARLSLARLGSAAALAVAPDQPQREDVPQLELPSSWRGHASLGLRRILRDHLTRAERDPVQVALSGVGSQDDGLDRLRRRLLALALGGRHSLPARGVSALSLESRRLAEQMQPTAAALLAHLASAALESQQDVTGVRFPADPEPLAEAWLACAAYEHAARLEFQQAAWQRAARG